MMRLRYKLSLFNILSKLIFGLVLVMIMPVILQRINTLQTDNELIQKREQVIELIGLWGVGFFMEETREDAFGSYNILLEEYISLEKVELDQHWNFIEVTRRTIEDEIIDYRVLNYTFLVDGEMYLLEIGKSLASIRQSEKNITRLMWSFLIIFIMVSAISDISFATYLIRPLEKISHKLKNTSSPALYDKSPLHSSTTEFAQLDTTLKELMEKIEDLFQKEKQTTANISHELLTPISVLRSKLENLLSQEELNEQSQDKTEQALRTLHRLTVMINSLLLIARVESHQYLRDDTFFIGVVLQEVVNELLPIAMDKDITIKLMIKKDKKLQLANRALIFTMFYNVVNNAIKFTPEKGLITISFHQDENRHIVSITDNGSGMSEVQKQRLFTRFKSPSSTHNHGIGLAIAKTIADFHHIQITVDSTVGKGTVFIFTFLP
jgi:signal transduction histidine kinase